MKILVVTHYFPAHRGGVEIVAGELVRRMCDRGFKITWIAGNCDQSPNDILGLKCLPLKVSNIIEKKLKIPYPIFGIKGLITIWKAVKKTDIIHIHDYLYLSNLVTFIFAKFYKKPLIITQHIGFIPYNNRFFRWLLSTLNSTLGCFILRHAHQVIFISEVVEKYFSQKTRFRNPSLMIPNGVDTDIFKPISQEKRLDYRQKLELPIKQIIFLFVGRFVEKKGLLIIKELVIKFPSIYWVFAGWGDLNPELWNLSNIQVFLDRKGKELATLYQCADLLILPSKGEGFPLVVQESMACGTPVMIGTETAKASTMAQNLIFFEVVETDKVVEKWSKKIENILANYDEVKNLKEKVANFAQEYWCWQKTADSYLQVFQKLS